VVRVGNTVYIAGQVSAARDGSVVGKGDPEAQVRQIWRNLEAAVASVGGTLEHIVKTTTYVTNISYAAAVRKVRDETYRSSGPPTSTLVVVAGLANPDYMVEIEAIAVVE
jgi:enamine deaminase RidA (YjgF/YER057c/UK114 family)